MGVVFLEDGYSYSYSYSYNKIGWPPAGAPSTNSVLPRDEQWRNFDSSVNAVSFGFVATAILISMFLVMAIFERFLRATSHSNSDNTSGGGGGDVESQLGFNPKLGYQSPKMSVYASGVSVLMPGDSIPTFIAHPAPVPCPPERIVPRLNLGLPAPTNYYSSSTTT